MGKLFSLLFSLIAEAAIATTSFQARGVAFDCGAGVEVHCVIPATNRFGAETRCWYSAGGRRVLMQSGAMNQFVAGPIRVRLIDAIPMSAGVVNLETGFRAFCTEG